MEKIKELLEKLKNDAFKKEHVLSALESAIMDLAEKNSDLIPDLVEPKLKELIDKIDGEKDL